MDSLSVPQSQITFKKKVGKSNGSEITHIKTVGGLHLMVDKKGTVLAAAPHRAVARHIAQKFDPDIVWTELSKSDHIDESAYAHLLPEYEALTETFRKAQGVK